MNKTKGTKCKWCRKETEITDAKECNRCWELSHRIEMDFKLAEKIFKHFKKLYEL